MRLTQIAFGALYVLSLLLSLFTVLAPRPLLEQSAVYLWGWVVLFVPGWWLVRFIRSLYRGGE